MTYTTLISTAELALQLFNLDWAIIDCRFSRADPERGRHDYKQEHVPGALYAHLDKDLSGSIDSRAWEPAQLVKLLYLFQIENCWVNIQGGCGTIRS